jgi:O-antigen ligase
VLEVALERRIRFWLIFCVGALTLVVNPWNYLDPINLPKLFVLAVSAFAIFGSLVPAFRRAIGSEFTSLVYGVIGFVVILFLVLFTSSSSKWGQIYGDYGRNTGLLAYFSLALLLLSAVFVSNRSFVERLMWALIVTGIANAIYGIFQWANLDPIEWNNPYNPIVGTLGNPNFASAHLGIASLASLALALAINQKLLVRVVLASNIGLSFFVILKSNSSQGLLIFGLGSVVIIYFRFLASIKFVALKIAYWGAVLVGVIMGIFGLLNKGPLAAYLYQVSVTYRGDYWRAGWKMTVENPLLGVGLDSYGNWYRFYRNETAALRRGPDVTSNSAHNVFLDISSNGGFLLLLAYLVMFGLIVRSGWRILRKNSGYDPIGMALVTSWLAYLVQSLISINQLGLAVWGWVMGGAIIGYDLYKDRPDAKISKKVKPIDRQQVSASSAITGTLGLALGITIAIWPSTQDINFRNALQGGDPEKIEKAVRSFPGHNYYYDYAAQIFVQNKLEDKALGLTRDAITKNPRDFNAWKVFISNPKISETERAEAIAKMKALDPFYNTSDK